MDAGVIPCARAAEIDWKAWPFTSTGRHSWLRAEYPRAILGALDIHPFPLLTRQIV